MLKSTEQHTHLNRWLKTIRFWQMLVSARQTEENRMRLKNKKIGKAGEISGTINILTALALNHADHLYFAENAWTAPRQMHQWHHSPSHRGYRGNRRRNSYGYNSQRGFSRGPYRSYNDRNYTPANREYASSSSIMTSSPGSRKSGNLNLFLAA